ncbi:YlxM family DNA-binding protein [Spiroplasma endosymbiont of Labia minor]|uniref:YlxM family DNA-binding protein n=1 Tax=Spiroplasma endosymbiont of Labia minor TaxID=3066305 RepID=UPI0030CFA677
MANIELQKNMNLIVLYDLYKNMLTVKQQKYFEYYYFEDFTLQEIANEFNVTRAAIFDSIIKTQQIIENLENKLNVKSNYEKIRVLLTKYAEKHGKDEDIEKILEVIS